jgi:hypothetical protein
MYAVIRRYNTQERTAEKIEQRVHDGFVPLLSALPGFVSYTLVRSTDGSLVSISTFETREGAEQSNHLASDWVHEHLASLVKTAPVILVGEVMVTHPAVAAAPARARPVSGDRTAEHRPHFS